jgi:hypothetical protein
MENKYGLLKLGFVKNIKPNEKGQNCLSILSKLIGREIRLEEINSFIESDDFNKEFFDINGNTTVEALAVGFRFKLPWQDVQGNDIYGRFSWSGKMFIGVFWDNRPRIQKFGNINPACWEKLQSICGIGVTESNIEDYITSNIEYYNGAGYTKFPDGTAVTAETGKFIKFNTSIRSSGEMLVGWFTKDIRSGRFEGISWGTEADFKSAQDLREQFYVGRMVFDSIEECNLFLEDLKDKIIPEPWEYKHKKDNTFKNPILKSYLQFELDRLFYEQDELKYPDRIIFNENNSKVWFNTNLINIYGKEMFLVGTLLEISNKIYIGEIKISPSKLEMRQMGFKSSENPKPPEFFKDINEIFFHWDWDIDLDMIKSEHIIGDRKERFPEKYQNMTTDSLGRILDSAIELAKNIAQRNYKFIVPMYYPTANPPRIQLLMPIFLEASYSSKPDFALVLTPHAEERLYTPETILGLDEVYQDARLIAKPEESWLNPEMIE